MDTMFKAVFDQMCFLDVPENHGSWQIQRYVEERSDGHIHMYYGCIRPGATSFTAAFLSETYDTDTFLAYYEDDIFMSQGPDGSYLHTTHLPEVP